MARLYFDFTTNIEHRNKEFNAPQLDTLIFTTKEGLLLRIGCSFESDWDLSKSAVMSGRWKGLEYSVEDTNGTVIEELTEEDNTEKLTHYLDNAKLVAFYMDEDDLMVNDYGPSFIPQCKDIRVSVEIYVPSKDSGTTYRKDFYEKDLITEKAYLDKISKNQITTGTLIFTADDFKAAKLFYEYLQFGNILSIKHENEEFQEAGSESKYTVELWQDHLHGFCFNGTISEKSAIPVLEEAQKDALCKYLADFAAREPVKISSLQWGHEEEGSFISDFDTEKNKEDAEKLQNYLIKAKSAAKKNNYLFGLAGIEDPFSSGSQNFFETHVEEYKEDDEIDLEE